ncbi:MAG TPA: histidine phosphatase family protein [Anaerolineales bacterium]|nr:histidine phosphatase family protein [Anaerolineales bacterium]
MATELILIRHGYTVRVNGDYVHAPLTPLGQKQAAQTGEYLSASRQSIDGFYTSPLRRAQETASIISSKISLKPIVKNGIREMEGLEIPALGLYEFASIFDPVEDYLDDRAGKSIRWPIEGRISKSLLEIIAAHPDQRVVVVAHSGVISAVLAWYFPEERGEYWLTTVRNCSLTRLAVDKAQVQIRSFNEIHHLSPDVVTEQRPDRAVQLAKVILAALKRSPLGRRRS